MRRDLCYHYSCDTQAVFNAYLNVIRAEFDKAATPNFPYTITFGLNFSFRYNMNGGTCTVHFMPVSDGTAIDIRYTIIQAFGARYEAHANKMNDEVAKQIGVPAKPCTIDIGQFIDYEAKSTSGYVPAPPPPPAAPAYASGAVCANCGASLGSGDKFCSGCGTPVPPPAPTPAPTPRFCGNCGTPTTPGALFCASCGKKLQ